MKNIIYGFTCLVMLMAGALPFVGIYSWNWNQSPVKIVEDINDKNSKDRDQVQDTKLDNVSSSCSEGIYREFTIARTLCSIKYNIKSYIQYAVYIGLAAATIILIRNGFQLVTATDKTKQMGAFKKNIMYIVIGVILLIAFYYILDIFVSVVNFVLE